MLSLRWAEKMESWMSTPRNWLMSTACSHSSQITKWPAIRYFSKFFKSKESLKSKILCVNEELLSHLEEIEYTETLRNKSKTTIWSSWHIRGWNSRVRHTFAPHETFYGNWLNYHQFLLCAQAVDLICCYFLDKYREEYSVR